MVSIGVVIGVRDREKPVENCARLSTIDTLHMVLVEQGNVSRFSKTPCDSYIFIHTSDMWNKSRSNNAGLDSLPDTLDKVMLLDGDLFLSNEDIDILCKLPKNVVYILHADDSSIHTGNILLPKEIALRYDERLAGWGWDDVDFLLRILKEGYVVNHFQLQSSVYIDEDVPQKRLDVRPGCASPLENNYINTIISLNDLRSPCNGSIEERASIEWTKILNLPTYDGGK